jgi:ATP-binding cassette subfamily B protein/subfamily B ATP-binding cassette protein MsbA
MQPRAGGSQELRRALSYLGGYRREAFGALVALLLVAAANLATPQLIRIAIDVGYTQGQPAVLIEVVIGLIVVALMRGLFTFLQGYLAERASQGVAFELREALFAQIQRLSFSYYDRAQTGQLMTRVTNDVEQVRTFVGTGVIQLAASIIMLVGTTVVLCYLNWRLTIAALLAIAPIFWLLTGFVRRVGPLFGQVQQLLGSLNTILQEDLSALRVIRAFGREQYELARYNRANTELLDRNVLTVRALSNNFPLVFLFANLSTLVVIGFGGALVMNQSLSIGELIAFNAYLAFLLQPILTIGFLAASISRASASAVRIFDVLDAPSDIQDRPGAVPLPPVAGEVVYDRVYFRYPGAESDVLCDVSFSAQPGQTVAVLGTTGSGKSTLVNLLPRFYDVTAGSVRVDGHDVRDVTLASLRGRGPRCTGARLHQRIAPGLRHGRRRTGRRPLGWSAPAPGDRPHPAGRSAAADSGRQHLGGRRRDRGGHPGGAGPADPRPQPDRTGDRPAHQHRARRRPDPGAGRRRHRCAGAPRGSAPRERAVQPDPRLAAPRRYLPVYRSACGGRRAGVELVSRVVAGLAIGPADGQARQSRATARRLIGELGAYRGELVRALGLLVISAAAQAAAPWLISQAIDRDILNGDAPGLIRTLTALLVVYVVGTLATRAQIFQIGSVGQKLLASLRNRLFEHFQRLPVAFFDRRPLGDLMSRVTNDVDTLNQLLSQGLTQLLGSLFGLVGIVIAMLILDVPLALVSFTVIPLIFLATSVFSRLARQAFRTTRQTTGDVTAELQEEISGIRQAQAFNRTEANIARFRERNLANRNANVSAVAVTSAFAPTIDVLSTLATAVVIGFGGYLLLEGELSVGVLAAFLIYVQQFFRPIQLVSQVYTQLQAALAGAERIYAMLDEPLEAPDPPSARELERVDGRVSFDGVWFGYDRNRPVLRDIRFDVAAGQTVALVGSTGAGKTTIVNLIPRFYDVTRGAVLIDGYDVRSVTRASLRRQLAIVLQEPFLFGGTVADNIAYGRLDASRAEIQAAAEAVDAHGFIEALPQGYDTQLAEHGGTLSQGQRQLLSFARAVLADPRILILDEATSSIDTRTEQRIQTALGRLLRGRTSIVIAHRLSTIRDADLILVIEAGRIVERGTHQTLLAAGGRYAELYRRQFRDLPARAAA